MARRRTAGTTRASVSRSVSASTEAVAVPSGRRQKLSPERVTGAALRIVEREGLDAVSMRRLAAECGVPTMTLYTYFRNKDEVLDRILDSVLNRLELPDDCAEKGLAGLADIMRAFRAVLLEQPTVVGLFLTRRVVTSGLTHSIEASLTILRDAGFSRDEAARRWAMLLHYTLGFVVFEIPRQGGEESDRAVGQELAVLAAKDGLPLVAESVDLLPTMAHEENFTHGLEAILSGFEKTLQARNSASQERTG